MQELEQLREQAKIISRLKEEITRLNVDLAQAEESKAAMLLEMEHLTAIAMQMSQTLKLHEREEEVAALERKHTSKAAAKNLMVLGLSAMLLHVQIQRRFKKLCDRLLTKHLVGTVDRALAEMQRVWLGWHDVVRTHRRLDRICALMSTKLRIGVQRLASAELQLVWSTWRCAVQSLRLINYMCDRTVTRQHIMLEDLALSNVQRVWSSWRQTAATKAAELKTERRKIQRVQLFMKRKLIETIGTPFRIWRTRIEELKTQRVDVWAEQAQNICLIERHLKRVQLRTAQGYLDAWYEYTVDEVQKVASVSRMILLMIERCLLMAFRQWCKHIRKCRLLERHLTRMNAKTARSCLDAWYTSGAEEAQKVASMSRMILRMLARLLSLAFQKWCDGVRRQKWERGDSELLHRCVEAESELQKYKGMLTEAGDRLNLAEKAVEAMLKSCGECAMTLDASKSRNIEQLFNLNSQLINLEEMNKKWITKNARKIQELSSRFEEDLLVKDKEIEVLEQAAIESSRHHAREMAEMEQRFAAEMQVKVHAVDTLSQGVASSSQELGAAIASTTARLLAFEETLRQVVAKKEKLKTLLQASTSLVARLEDELAEKYTRVEELEAEKNALFKRCTHAESEWVRCVQEAADMHQEQVLEKDTCRRVIESAKKCVARMVREQQELQNMVRQDFLRAVRDVEDAMGTQSLKESIPGIVSPAVDSVNMSTSCRLSCFVDHLSGVVTDFAAYKRRLISWMELKVQQIHGLCDETVAVQLMIEAFNKMCNCRLDTLIEKCQQIVAQKLDLEGMLAETNFDLTETKKRVRDLEILIKREEQDCANLEKGMDQVTRRLLETENKLERMVSWNAELQEKVQLCHYAASPVNITDDTTPRHVGVQNVLSRAVKSAFSISSGGLIDLSHSNLSSPYQQETSKHVKAFSAQSDNAEALKQHEKEPLFEKSLPPTSVRSDGTREDVEGPSTDERVVELRNEILNSLEESKNIPSCSESNEAKVLQTPVEEKGNWDLGLGSGLGASGVAGVSGVIALSAGHSLLDLFSPRKPAPTPQAKSERDSEGGLIISSAPKLALTVPKLKLDFLNDEGALDNKTALESIEEVDESSRPASMVMASNLTAASAADSDWMESMQKLENLAASTSASGSYAGSPLAERLAGSPLGIKPGENPRPKSLKGQNWLDL